MTREGSCTVGKVDAVQLTGEEFLYRGEGGRGTGDRGRVPVPWLDRSGTVDKARLLYRGEGRCGTVDKARLLYRGEGRCGTVDKARLLYRGEDRRGTGDKGKVNRIERVLRNHYE